ncbi:flagellar basal body stator protein MotB [Bryobacterales bacterium F-183]|nr:flagellar basal body stator protein MotB [Bryobacterales bacterium F-183]
MARKKKHEEHVNHERWLVSYADFITLLFAFFVVMFASTQADKARAQKMADSVKRAFEESSISAVLGGGGHKTAKGTAGGPETKPTGELAASFETLARELAAEIGRSEVQLKMESRGLVVSFAQSLLFASGEAIVFESSFPALDKVARACSKIPNLIRLEGHTDSVPISNSRFRSNWELSAARSIAILEDLSTRGGIDRKRLSIGGYADVAPTDSNDTPEGRAKNRRVDIVILNQAGAALEPSGAKR